MNICEKETKRMIGFCCRLMSLYILIFLVLYFFRVKAMYIFFMSLGCFLIIFIRWARVHDRIHVYAHAEPLQIEYIINDNVEPIAFAYVIEQV